MLGESLRGTSRKDMRKEKKLWACQSTHLEELSIEGTVGPISGVNGGITVAGVDHGRR